MTDAWLVPAPAIDTDLRQAATGSYVHTRTPETVAHIALGWKIFLRYATDVGAITEREATVLFNRVWDALGSAAEHQRHHQESQEPARLFIEALGSVLSGGLGHVATREGTRPDNSGTWGWRKSEGGTWAPQGPRVGWVDGDDLYINRDVTVAAARPIVTIPVTPRTLTKRLHERGYLNSTDGEGEGLQVRRVLEGTRRRVLHLSTTTIGVEKSGQSVQSGHESKNSPNDANRLSSLSPSCGRKNPPRIKNLAI